MVISTWRDRAACLDTDTELFFPLGTTGPVLEQINRAKHVCSWCPVRVQCLEWALETGQAAGIWGGRTEDERQALRRAAGQRTARMMLSRTMPARWPPTRRPTRRPPEGAAQPAPSG